MLSARAPPRRAADTPLLPPRATEPMKLGQHEESNNLSSCSTNDSFEGQITRKQSQGTVNAGLAASQPSGSIEALCQALVTPPTVGRAAASLAPLPIPRVNEGVHDLPVPSPRQLTVSEAAVQHPVLLNFQETSLVSPRGLSLSARCSTGVTKGLGLSA